MPDADPRVFSPHSIDDRAFWEPTARLPALAGFRARLAEAAAAVPDRPLAVLSSDILAIRRGNDRGPSDRANHQQSSDCSLLVLQRLFLGEGEDDRLLDHLWALATAPSWSLGAHLDRDLPRLAGAPTLDLGSCSIASALAEAFEVLAPWLAQQSPSLLDSLVACLDRQVLAPFGNGQTVWWEDPEHMNNWQGVCAGFILSACAALAALGRPRPAARARARAGMKRFLHHGFTPAGECDEGVGYWGYGLGSACLGLSRLGPGDLDDADLVRLRQVAAYPRLVHLGGDLFFSGNDGGLRARAAPSFVPWLATATGDPWLAAWAGAATGESEHWHVARCLRTIDALRRGLVQPATLPEPPAARLLPDQQVAILRRATSRGDLVALLSGGHNAERHNHNDLGQVQVLLDGRPLIVDLGAPTPYPADFFGPGRYGYLAASSRGHCVPLVNGCEQRDGRDAAGRICGWSEGDGLELELAAAYPAEARLESWRRRLTAQAGGMLLGDRWRLASEGQIEHVLWSTVEPLRLAGGLRLGDLRLDYAPAPVALTIDPVDPLPLHLKGFDGPLFRIAARYRGREIAVETHFEPVG